MAEGLLGGILEEENETPEVEPPVAPAAADTFNSRRSRRLRWRRKCDWSGDGNRTHVSSLGITRLVPAPQPATRGNTGNQTLSPPRHNGLVAR